MYSKHKNDAYNKNKKRFIITALTLLLVTLLIAAIATKGFGLISDDNDSKTSDTSDPFVQPPTQEESEIGNEVEVKENADPTTDKPAEDTDSDEAAEDVSVIISNAGVYDGKVEVSAFTPDVIASGTCTYTFVDGDDVITKTALARADASSTICLDEPFPVSELSASESWEVTVSYESDSNKYKGKNKITLTL